MLMVFNASSLKNYTVPGTDITIEEGRYVKIYNTDISRQNYTVFLSYLFRMTRAENYPKNYSANFGKKS